MRLLCRHNALLSIGSVVLMFALVVPALGQPSRGFERDGEPIDAGLVVIDGRLIEKPYTIVTGDDNQISINGQAIGEMFGANWRSITGETDGAVQADDLGRGDRDRRSRWRDGPRWSAASLIARGLIQDGAVWIVTDVGYASIARYSVPEVVDILASDVSVAMKAEELASLSSRRVPEAFWTVLAERSVVTDAVKAEAQVIEEELDTLRKSEKDEASAGSGYSALMPVLSIAGVLLAIAVLVHTLRRSWDAPVEHRGWRHIDPTGQRTRAVFQLAAVLVLLNGLDLLFTIIANRTGQFVELSPIGDVMINNPVALGFYKTTLVAVGVGILLFLRQRRAAEVTAWWLCALYMLVLVRWVAVNTVMIA